MTKAYILILYSDTPIFFDDRRLLINILTPTIIKEMSRKVLQLIFIAGLFGSCHKAEVASPVTQTTNSTEFKDDHIYVSSVNLLRTEDGSANFSFTTRYEKGISKIEVFKGSTPANLCSVYQKTISEDSHSLKTYIMQDTNNGKEMNYYMIKYKTLEGEWSYSSVYQLKLK